MNILFFDTETSGLPRHDLPNDHEDQPFVVQLAAILMSDAQNRYASMDVIIHPENRDIHPKAVEVHGISTAHAWMVGVYREAPFLLFDRFAQAADLIVAHNVSFDITMMQLESEYLSIAPAWFNDRPVFCTMERSKHIINLPPTPAMRRAGIDEPKSPKLSEAYEHFFREPLVGAHDAMVDVEACARIYWHLQSLKDQSDV